MTELVYRSSIETYPYMKRRRRKWVKAVDYLAWRVQTLRTIAWLHSMRNANEPKVDTVMQSCQFEANGATQMKRTPTVRL